VADPLHTNTVTVITAQTAARFPFGEAGQVLVSFRELGAVGVLDPDGEALVWAARGPWIGQHDPDLLPNGNILLFDNYGNFANPEGRSRVIEFDPKTMAIVWHYGGSAEWPLESAIRSSQQRLANGNTLITERAAAAFSRSRTRARSCGSTSIRSAVALRARCSRSTAGPSVSMRTPWIRPSWLAARLGHAKQRERKQGGPVPHRPARGV
jgi:Arylsulfotransferase (ASST)